nr:zinc knuckle CX2CX4HX4C [Tanacetum cinerariifolium]
MGRSGSVTNQGLKLSQSATIVDVSQQIGVPPDTLKDIDNLTKSIDLGKLEVWSDLPSEKRKEVMETIWAMWDAFLTENLNATSGYSLDSGKSDVGIGIERGTYEVWSKLNRIQRKAILKTAHDGWIALFELDLAGLGALVTIVPSVVSPCEPIVKTINTDNNSDPIVQSLDNNTMPTSYVVAVGANNKDQPKVMFKFLHLVAYLVFNAVDISIPHKVVKKVSSWFENTLYEAVLEGGPWLIRKALIILKKWSMDTKLLKEELNRIPIWVKLHDVPLQVFEEDGRSSFARCLIELNSEADLVEAVTIGIPLLTGENFTKETIRIEYEWRPPSCDECKIFGHVYLESPLKWIFFNKLRKIANLDKSKPTI